VAEGHLPAAAALTLAATLIAVAGGFSLVISYLATDAIRSWNRMSIVIAFLSLFALGVLLERLRPRLPGAWAWPALLTALLVVASLDQVPGAIVPSYAALARVWRGEGDYFRGLEARLPDGALVYNAPYFPFPERGYDEARGYLHSNKLRWSFGAVEGRPADWAAGLAGQQGDLIVPSVAAAGFSGVLVDTALYPDQGAAADSDLRRLTGAAPITSRDGSYRFYDLRAYRARLGKLLGPDIAALRDRTLHPVRIEYGPEFSTPTFESGDPLSIANVRYTDRPSGSLGLVNPSRFTRRVTFTAQLVNEQGGTASGAIQWPDGSVERVELGESEVPLRKTFRIKPGAGTIRIVTSLPSRAGADTYLSLRNVTMADDDALALAQRARVTAGAPS
jgi:phosphoglycerol transferase